MTKVIYPFALMLYFPLCLHAELRTTMSLDSSFLSYQVSGEDFDDRSSTSLQIQPSVGAILNGQRFSASANASHRYIDSTNSSSGLDGVDFNDKNNLTNYSVDSNLQIVQGILSVNARGSQSFQNTDTVNSLISNDGFNNSQITKTQTESLGFNFILDNSNFMGFNLLGYQTHVKTDRSYNSLGGIDSDNSSLSARFYSKENFNRVNWYFTGDYIDTNGQGTNDITSYVYSGKVYLGLINDFRLVINGNMESNEFSSEDVDDVTEIEYNSAGVGLSYYRSAAQHIDVTYNVSSENEGDREQFVGVDFDWRFSARTSASGSYGRRFFGDSGRLDFSYGVRKLKATVTYTESVSNFTRLVAGQQVSGVIVCPVASVDFTDCFVPPSSDYTLGPGEEYQSFNFNLAELSENTTIRKSLQSSIGLNLRRITGSLSLQHSNTEFVETGREQSSYSVVASANLSLSRKSNISWSNSYTYTDRSDVDDASSVTDKTLSSSLSLSHDFSPKLKTSVRLQIIDKNSPIQNRDFVSRQLFLRMSYKFK
ncbi:hypothetical protein Q4567_00415 [Aliiglaciecola sp. 2_MG-2023]|uniref:hypothetical protein n=1 Tax=unclassified Aliiglaciecola TaxID=2593648 RepID=UPI0026E19828|nr:MULTISPECIES: hypothetical protein [unclassified Aliiglaciecola]MDO6709171.1 hypothetical protein [Aliiglaciecola sp. 2_MG-2023]MDO6750319.1 hypothetical protein [Aliiglaciecola sp. 1_MG-2023]